MFNSFITTLPFTLSTLTTITKNTLAGNTTVRSASFYPFNKKSSDPIYNNRQALAYYKNSAILIVKQTL